MSSRYYPKPDAGLKACEYAATFEQIAREIGVSKERVRQIESQALAKAEKILRRRGYTLQDLLDGERNS